MISGGRLIRPANVIGWAQLIQLGGFSESKLPSDADNV
jgi:hypothetical protein